MCSRYLDQENSFPSHPISSPHIIPSTLELKLKLNLQNLLFPPLMYRTALRCDRSRACEKGWRGRRGGKEGGYSMGDGMGNIEIEVEEEKIEMK